jgi:uncharacterized protein (DUF2147 family)
MFKRSKGVKRISLFAVLIGLLIARPLPAAESPVGRWKTVDRETGKVVSTVEVYDQGGKLFGKIVALIEPNNQQGKPKICAACTGADKDKPIVGLVILRDLNPSGDRYRDGTVLDPEDGKVYKADIWVEDGNLKMRGYFGMFYRTHTWPKAN